MEETRSHAHVREEVEHTDDSPFFFLGEALALDLVNTEILVRGQPCDLLATPADLARWWEVVRVRYPEAGTSPSTSGEPAWDAALLVSVTRLRSALRRLFTAVAGGRPTDPADVTVLNAALQAGIPRVEMTANGRFAASYGVRDDGVLLLLSVALSALHLLTAANPHRLHECANERCVLLFYDSTKSGTRRWHSPDCMNRARSAERYRRQRQERRDASEKASQDVRAITAH